MTRTALVRRKKNEIPYLFRLVEAEKKISNMALKIFGRLNKI